MNKDPLISICIPYHTTKQTAFFLSRLLDSINSQTYSNYEVVLTNEPSMAHNHNEAMRRGKGELLKLMQMDDYFAHPDALGDIFDTFQDEETKWLISGTEHTDGSQHMPFWSPDIYTGRNTLGSISTLTMRKDSLLLFEEPLTWLVDVDLYWRLFLKYGKPTINIDPAIIVDTRHDRLTHTIPDDIKLAEQEYVLKKYGK